LVVREEQLSGRFLGLLGGPGGGEEPLEEGAQKPRQPAQEEAEIVAGGGEHGVAAVAVAPIR
jgi:hypothetical protein